MKHECRITVIDKKCFTDFQKQYLADPGSGPCPFFYNIAYRKKAGELARSFKSLNGNVEIYACCNGETRPVIFKIERIDIPENYEEREWLAR